MPLGLPVQSNLTTQGNIGNAYHHLGRLEEALPLRRDVYSGTLKLHGEEGYDTLAEAINYSSLLISLRRYEETKLLMRRMLPVARRVLGESHDFTLKLRWNYAQMLSEDSAATLDDLREAVATLEQTERTTRRVLGGAHPDVMSIERALRKSRGVLSAREVSSVCEAVEAMTPGDA